MTNAVIAVNRNVIVLSAKPHKPAFLIFLNICLDIVPDRVFQPSICLRQDDFPGDLMPGGYLLTSVDILELRDHLARIDTGVVLLSELSLAQVHGVTTYRRVVVGNAGLTSSTTVHNTT